MGASQGGSDVQPAAPVADPAADEKKKREKAAAGLGAGINAGLSSLDAQPQQVAAGPQTGQALPQAQATDPYQAYLLRLQQQQQNQTPFYGN